jgi:hypothetical protein
MPIQALLLSRNMDADVFGLLKTMSKQEKKIVILWHNGGRLGNQLWQHINVYAYALRKGYGVDNRSFFEYGYLYGIQSKSLIVNLLFYRTFPFLCRAFKKHFSSKVHTHWVRKVYGVYRKTVAFVLRKNVVYALDEKVSLGAGSIREENLLRFEGGHRKSMYLYGWLFTDPVGIRKYHKKITEIFTPIGSEAVDKYINDLRKRYDRVIGVHIRKGDYKTIKGGDLYFSEEKVSGLLKEYINIFGLTKDNVCFVVCSDGDVDLSVFAGLAVFRYAGNSAQDIYCLSRTDTILGADSTFGGVASYFGNIPFIVFKKEIDWNYYKDKHAYFENVYSQMNKW